MKKRLIILALCLGLWFMAAVVNLEQGRQTQGARQLEQVLRQTAAACYASEGFYPPSLEYMMDHYGLLYDDGDYHVHYSLFASNLMPEITVVERQP